MAGSNKSRISIGTLVLVVLAVLANQFIFGFGTAKANSQGDPAAPPAAAAPAGIQVPTADPGPGFRSRRSLDQHFEKHGREFGAKVETVEDYLAMARRLRDREPGPRLLEETREDGVITRFDRDSGAFLAFNRDRTIRTLFKPNDGERYFHRQLNR